MRSLRSRLLRATVCVASMITPIISPLTILPPIGALELALSQPPALAQGIPVIDIDSIAEQIKELFQELQSYLTQLDQWWTQNMQWLTQIKQYTTEAEQYLQILFMVNNFIHEPNIGTIMSLLNMAGLNIDLPINPYAIMSLANGYSSWGSGSGNVLNTLQGSLSGLNSLVSTVHTNDNLYTCTSDSWFCDMQKSQSFGYSGSKAMLGNLMQDAQKHLDALNTIRSQLNTTSDPKTVADIQAQLAVEQAWLLNTLIQVNAVNGLSATQHNVTQQQGDEKLSNDIDSFVAACPNCGG